MKTEKLTIILDQITCGDFKLINDSQGMNIAIIMIHRRNKIKVFRVDNSYLYGALNTLYKETTKAIAEEMAQTYDAKKHRSTLYSDIFEKVSEECIWLKDLGREFLEDIHTEIEKITGQGGN